VTATTLDPKSALIVVDLQKGVVSLATVHPIDGVVKHADAHAYSITRIFPRIGETGTTQEIIDLLERSA
jgi:nicotinamidase-related amidase